MKKSIIILFLLTLCFEQTLKAASSFSLSAAIEESFIRGIGGKLRKSIISGYNATKLEIEALTEEERLAVHLKLQHVLLSVIKSSIYKGIQTNLLPPHKERAIEIFNSSSLYKSINLTSKNLISVLDLDVENVKSYDTEIDRLSDKLFRAIHADLNRKATQLIKENNEGNFLNFLQNKVIEFITNNKQFISNILSEIISKSSTSSSKVNTDKLSRFVNDIFSCMSHSDAVQYSESLKKNMKELFSLFFYRTSSDLSLNDESTGFNEFVKEPSEDFMSYLWSYFLKQTHDGECVTKEARLNSGTTHFCPFHPEPPCDCELIVELIYNESV